ncbi:MAG TPA: hypothetical protein VFN78_01855 [Ktedonobacterales bacterium]|nr:hypothetical protein [Ktedonobacterales bacterium]
MGSSVRSADRQDKAATVEAPSGPLAPRRFTALDAAMLATLLLLVAGHIVSALGRFGWPSAVATVGLTALALLALTLRRAWRPLLVRLLAFGLVAGVCELFTDFSGEVVAHSLSYPPNEPMLWASPFYMPLSWMVVLTQIGYLAWRLDTLAPRPPRWLAMALVGVWGALNIPFYEEMAYHANWWRYAHAPGLGHTPFYVMLFEGLIAVLLPPLLARLQWRAPHAVLLRGLALGAWIPCAALVSWLLIGR